MGLISIRERNQDGNVIMQYTHIIEDTGVGAKERSISVCEGRMSVSSGYERSMGM